jgi:two-component system phosphate regulon sensor histidine kinase PhoR
LEGFFVGLILFLLGLSIALGTIALKEKRRALKLLYELKKEKKRNSKSRAPDRSKLLARALSLIREGIVIMDPFGRVIFTNRFARELLDIDEKDIGKYFYQAIKNFDIVSLINEAFNEKYRVWQEKKIKEHYVQIIFGSDMDEKVLLLIDLTPIKKYENLKKDFIANVSHELKTPLAAMKLSLETLEEECKENPRASLFINKALERVSYMEQLIEDLITLSQLESVKVKVKFEEIKLQPLVKEILKGLSEFIVKKGIKVDLNVPEEATIYADRKMLYAVLKNLIDNAIKYNREGGKVKVEFRELQNEKEISVCDTGYGIPKSHIPFIFERFYRVERSRSRKSGGTGLGLSIVKLAVDRMGGTVEVESQVDKGTCFRVFLPKRNL